MVDNLHSHDSFRHINKNDQDAVITSFMPLVKRVVRRLAGRLPSDVDIKEMLNSGIIGLVDALEKYDPTHETNFATYAQFRIRGAILDSFRSQDWVPRSLRHKASKLEDAFLRLEQKLGRQADDAEIAEELGVDMEEYRQMLQDVSGAIMLSFEELNFGHGEERFISHKDIQQPRANSDPLIEVLQCERVEIIARALDRLADKERLVITLYFYEELNLKEIGDILGVTESRASQIRSRALIRLRGYLRRAF